MLKQGFLFKRIVDNFLFRENKNSIISPYFMGDLKILQIETA